MVKDVRPCLGQSQVTATMDAFALDHAEEALGGGIVGAVADLAHAAEDVVIGKEALILTAGKLRAAIRMQHQQLSIRSLPAGHQHRLDHQVTVLDAGHRPAHDLVIEQIEHRAQIQPTFGGMDVGDVSDPLGVRFQRREVAVQMIPDMTGPHAAALALP